MMSPVSSGNCLFTYLPFVVSCNGHKDGQKCPGFPVLMCVTLPHTFQTVQASDTYLIQKAVPLADYWFNNGFKNSHMCLAADV